MPAIYIKTCRLKDVLNKLPQLPPHNWLISNLECYDYCNWEGCEKWAESDLFLTDEQLRKDISFRNMQIIWGALSAIPIEYSKEEVYSQELPWLENPYYMSNRIIPQHPLALMEVSVFDGCYTIVSSKDAALLQPLYELEMETRDEEMHNRKLNMELCRIQDMLRSMVPDVSPEIADEVQWKCWHALFRESKELVSDEMLSDEVAKRYEEIDASGYIFGNSYWDPYIQK